MFFLYLIAFSLTTNRYLRSKFEDLSFNQKHFTFHTLACWSHVILPCLNPHVTSISSSQLLEICCLNTFSTFNSGLLSHVVSSRDTSRDILPFTLSIPFDHPSSLIILLGWSFYNSKSSISNGSASPFGRRIIHFYPIQSSQFSRWLLEAPALVVPLIVPLVVPFVVPLIILLVVPLVGIPLLLTW